MTCRVCGYATVPLLVRDALSGARLVMRLCQSCGTRTEPVPVGVDEFGKLVPERRRETVLA